MDKAIIKKTHDTLGKAIKKPPLLEKLLNKPPFRFIHDILTEVVKTGVFDGLYSDHELNSSNVSVSVVLSFLLNYKIIFTSKAFRLMSSVNAKDFAIF